MLWHRFANAEPGELPTYVGVGNRKILYHNPLWFGIRLGCERLLAVNFDGLELLSCRQQSAIIGFKTRKAKVSFRRKPPDHLEESTLVSFGCCLFSRLHKREHTVPFEQPALLTQLG